MCFATVHDVTERFVTPCAQFACPQVKWCTEEDAINHVGPLYPAASNASSTIPALHIDREYGHGRAGGIWCSGDPLRSLCLRSSRLEEIVGLGIPLRSFWPTLLCRRVAGVSPLLSIGWWLSLGVPEETLRCRVSAADKVYPLDPRPDIVVLYSGCTSGKRRAWYLPDDQHTASLVGLRGGWRHSRMKTISLFMDPEILCPGKGLVLPNINIDTIATNSRFLILSLPNHAMSRKSPFAIQKALKGIGGDPKSVKKLRSGDLLIETVSALQTKSFLSAKIFLDCPLIVTPHTDPSIPVEVSYLNQTFCAPPKQKSWKDFLTKGLLKSDELK
ncbi:uncharacterized protein TNCV_3873961 [Trichonephila clavipes]|nr:uncharacterized protein TNCV_3873961 [Trichonephila clavipes]